MEETKSYLRGECAVLLQQLINPSLFLTVVCFQVSTLLYDLVYPSEESGLRPTTQKCPTHGYVKM